MQYQWNHHFQTSKTGALRRAQALVAAQDPLALIAATTPPPLAVAHFISSDGGRALLPWERFARSPPLSLEPLYRREEAHAALSGIIGVLEELPRGFGFDVPFFPLRGTLLALLRQFVWRAFLLCFFKSTCMFVLI